MMFPPEVQERLNACSHEQVAVVFDNAISHAESAEPRKLGRRQRQQQQQQLHLRDRDRRSSSLNSTGSNLQVSVFDNANGRAEYTTISESRKLARRKQLHLRGRYRRPSSLKSINPNLCRWDSTSSSTPDKLMFKIPEHRTLSPSTTGLVLPVRRPSLEKTDTETLIGRILEQINFDELDLEDDCNSDHSIQSTIAVGGH